MTLNELNQLTLEQKIAEHITIWLPCHFKLVETEDKAYGEARVGEEVITSGEFVKNSQPPEFDWDSFLYRIVLDKLIRATIALRRELDAATVRIKLKHR